MLGSEIFMMICIDISLIFILVLMLFIPYLQSAVHPLYPQVKFAFENYGWSIRWSMEWVHKVVRGPGLQGSIGVVHELVP